MQDFLFVKDGPNLFQVLYSELQYVESIGRYVRFVTKDKGYLTEGSLYKIEEHLPPNEFCRIHRSYIVSLRHAKHLNAKIVTVGGTELPIGRTYRGCLWAKVTAISKGRGFSGTDSDYAFKSAG